MSSVGHDTDAERFARFVNTDTLLSLQIIQSESHPNSHYQGPTKVNSGSKEGLSIYGLFHHLARTPQGKFLLRQYFLRPSLNLHVINERLSTIVVLLRPDNAEFMDSLTKHLNNIKNMRQVMVNLRKGVSAGSGKIGGVASTIWYSLRLFLYHALKITDVLRDLVGADRLIIRNRILENFDTHRLQELGRTVESTIDFESSKEHGRTVVNHGIDEELDRWKQTYDGLESILARTAEHVSLTVPSELNIEVNVIFFPQIGFLVAVDFDSETGTGVWEGIAADPWEKMFVTETIAYYKNKEASEMDAYFGDIYGNICGTCMWI